MRCIMLVLMLFGLLTALAALAEDAPKSGDAKIQGTWIPTGLSIGGKPLAELPKDLPTWVFTKEKVVIKVAGKADEEAAYKLDASKDPKEIDIGGGNNTLKGIYVLDGDTLNIALYSGGKERPTKLDAEGVVLEILKRQAKK